MRRLVLLGLLFIGSPLLAVQAADPQVVDLWPGKAPGDVGITGEEKFDVIFMDCEMPFMDGFETTRRLRQWEKETQQAPHLIIALTAHALPEHRERCLAAGMNDYLSKPLLLVRLVEKLHGILPRQVAGPDHS